MPFTQILHIHILSQIAQNQSSHLRTANYKLDLPSCFGSTVKSAVIKYIYTAVLISNIQQQFFFISNKILFTKRGSGKRKILFLFLATWYLNGFMITFKPHWSFHMYLACVFSNVNEYINFLSDIPKYNHKIWLIPIPVKSKSKL